jgi:ATP-dependent RNA helicase DDX10/DBP4
LRSIHLHKDKSIFKLDQLPTDRYAESLGLPGAPKIKFLKAKQRQQNSTKLSKENSHIQQDSDTDISESSDSESAEEKEDTQRLSKVCFITLKALRH